MRYALYALVVQFLCTLSVLAPDVSAQPREARKLDLAARKKAVTTKGDEVSIPTAVTAGTQERIALLRRHHLLIEPREVPIRPPDASVTARRYLPATLAALGRASGSAGAEAELRCAVFIEILNKPLRWSNSTKMYAAPVAVGLENLTPRVKPTPGFSATVTVIAENAELDRSVFQFARVETLETQLRTSRPGTPVTVSARLGESRIEDAALADSPLGGLELIATHPTIEGFGRGSTELTVRRVDPQGVPIAPDNPLDVTLSVDGSGRLEARELTLLPARDMVGTRLHAGERGGATINVSGGGFQARTYVTYVTAVLGELRMAARYPSILGFGIGHTPVTVERLDDGGLALTKDTLRLDLAVQEGRGYFEPETGHVIADGTSSLEVTFRSEGFEEATILARAGSMQSGKLRIDFFFPWLEILCALVGSLIGGTLRWLTAETAGGRKKRLPPWRVLVEAALTALVLVVAVLLGLRVGWLPAAVARTAAGAFVVGAAGGFLGVAAIEGWLGGGQPSPTAQR